MNKRINSKMIVELARKNSKSLNFKNKPLDPNEIIEIRTEAMRIRGIPPITMARKEYEKISKKRIKEKVRIFKKLLISLQKEQESKKNHPEKKVEFELSYL